MDKNQINVDILFFLWKLQQSMILAQTSTIYYEHRRVTSAYGDEWIVSQVVYRPHRRIENGNFD
jgi:hypothetical protein